MLVIHRPLQGGIVGPEENKLSPVQLVVNTGVCVLAGELKDQVSRV